VANGTSAFTLKAAKPIIELKRARKQAQHLFSDRPILDLEDFPEQDA